MKFVLLVTWIVPGNLQRTIGTLRGVAAVRLPLRLVCSKLQAREGWLGTTSRSACG